MRILLAAQAFSAFVAAESGKWGKVIRDYGIKSD